MVEETTVSFREQQHGIKGWFIYRLPNVVDSFLPRPTPPFLAGLPYSEAGLPLLPPRLLRQHLRQRSQRRRWRTGVRAAAGGGSGATTSWVPSSNNPKHSMGRLHGVVDLGPTYRHRFHDIVSAV